MRMRSSLRMGLYINVAGMLLALVGAEQIVGTLVAKVLYSQGVEGGRGISHETAEPPDIARKLSTWWFVLTRLSFFLRCCVLCGAEMTARRLRFLWPRFLPSSKGGWRVLSCVCALLRIIAADCKEQHPLIDVDKSTREGWRCSGSSRLHGHHASN